MSPTKVLRDRIGPMGPDSTAVRMYRAGRILGFERGQGCDRLLALRPIVNAKVLENLPVDARQRLHTPVNFFVGDNLAIQFQPRPRETLPIDAEASLIVAYTSPTTAAGNA